MKRICLLLLALLCLAGCAHDVAPTLPPTEPTEPPLPWTEAVGTPWDDEGVLLEMPLTIPDGLHYSASMSFDGDLLLWSVDNHLTDRVITELCVVELDDGSIIAQRDLALSEYVEPQALGDELYLCDRSAGVIYRLNKELQTVKQWNTEAGEGSWYMGAGERLYRLDADSRLSVWDLSSGESGTVLEGDPEVSWMTARDGYAALDYYRSDTGGRVTAVLDLYTGTVHCADFGEGFDSISLVNGNWLCGKYMDGYIFYLSVDGKPAVQISRQDNQFSLLREDYLLETTSDNTCLRLYSLDGSLVSSACIFASGSGYPGQDLIWNEALGGYFFQVRSYNDTIRLLFWDISKSAGGADLTLTEVPEPDEVQVRLKERAEQIGQAYGLTILVGEDCGTVFEEFTAQQVIDWDRVNTALDTLEEALEAYPGGFFRQLRYDHIRGIQIQLVDELWADGSGRYGDGYAAFTQPQWDHYLMVMDIGDTSPQTYYHEFSHITDAYLDWDAGQRENALFSEEVWASLNPDWFTGYSYDYSIEHDLADYSSFVDGYSTIKPTEDRARVMENAMAGCTWTFEGCQGLLSKLNYYSRCIRDAFDTTGWPETTLWEKPLR